MFRFFKIQYELGKIGETELEKAVAKGHITEEQKDQILGWHQ